MPDEINPSLAGDGADQTLAGELEQTGPLTIDAAVERLSSLDAARTQAPEPPAHTEPPAPVETVEAAPATEAETVETNTAEPPPIDWDSVPGTARFRLRDGREFTAADAKRWGDDFLQVDRARQDFSQRWDEYQRGQAQIAQQQQYLSHILPMAMKFAQKGMPQPPELPTDDPSDPIGSFQRWNDYQRKRATYETEMGELQQVHAAEQRQREQAERHEAERKRQWGEHQRESLLKAKPEFADPVKAKAFFEKFVKLGKSIGFTDEEMAGGLDHRIVLLADLAVQMADLKANPPRPAPAPAAQPKPQAAPVAAPGARVAPGQVPADAKRQELLRKARASGGLSIDDASRLLMALEN